MHIIAFCITAKVFRNGWSNLAWKRVDIQFTPQTLLLVLLINFYASYDCLQYFNLMLSQLVMIIESYSRKVIIRKYSVNQFKFSRLMFSSLISLQHSAVLFSELWDPLQAGARN